MNGFRRTLIVVLLFLGAVAMYDGSKRLGDQQDQITTLSTQVQNQYDTLYDRLDAQAQTVASSTREAKRRIDYHMSVLIGLTKEFDLSVLDSCGIIISSHGFGSCVAIGPDLILTAGHCTGMSGAWVEIMGVKYDILEEWRHPVYDVGFVRIDADLPYLGLGRKPSLLDEVYLVGAPTGFAFVNNISKGVVTNLDVDWWNYEYATVVDASGYAGCSGGPLLNVNGKIIGIHVARPARNMDNICVSVPVHQIRSALRSYYAPYFNYKTGTEYY